MEGLTLTTREQNRLQTLNGVLEKHWPMWEAAKTMGVSERQGWRILAAYRKEGAAALAHGNRGRTPANATPLTICQQVVTMTKERYCGMNHTHLAELLAEREGIMLSRSTLRRLLTRAGLPSPRRGRSPLSRFVERARQAGKQIGMLPVEEREGFSERFAPILAQLEQKAITHKQAAKELGISCPTLKRILDGHSTPTWRKLVAGGERAALVV